MSPLSLGRSTVALAALAFVTFGAQQAFACTPPPDWLVRLSSDRVPADGLLVGHFLYAGCSFDVVGEDGETISGEFVAGDPILGELVEGQPVDRGPVPEGRSFFAWKPESAWVEGARYRVLSCDRSSGLSRNDVEFVIAPPAQPIPTFVEHFSRMERGESFVQCVSHSDEYTDSLRGSCQDYGGFFERVIYEASLGIKFEGAAAGQYRYEVTWSSAEEELTEQEDARTAVGHSFRGTPEEVCYEVTAEAIDPAREGFHLPRKCFSTAELDPLGKVEEPWGGMNTVLAACTVPPPAYRDEWCALFTSAIEAENCGDRGESCEAALKACEIGEDGEGVSAGGGDGDGSNSNGDGSNSDGAGDDNSSKGCAFSGTTASRGGAGGWLLFLAALGGSWFVSRGRGVTRRRPISP